MKIINFIFNINMYKYIFFVVLGILIYLYYNRNDNFSVGGQITQSIEQLESMARRIAMGIEDPSQKLCAISGVGQCQLEQDRLGGSCSINALAGLVYTSASFTTEYQEYLNRLGAEIMHNEQLLNAYRCVMNMRNMVDTLVSNNLNPRRTGFVNSENKLLDLNRDISILYNRLYMLFLRFKPNLNIVMGNHYFLIYRITKRKLGRLLEFMNENQILYDDDDPNNGYMKYDEILHRLTTVYEGKNEPGEPIVDPMIDGSFGLLIIDFCNGIFDIITDQSFPITTPAERFAQVYTEEYNNIWKLKILWYWMNSFRLYAVINYESNNIRVDTTTRNQHLKTMFVELLLDNIKGFVYNTYQIEILDNLGEMEEIKECDINPPSECATSVDTD